MRPPPVQVPFDKDMSPHEAWIDWATEAFRVLKKNHGSGTTASRPVNSIETGDYYFDTTLGHPIWYDGDNWVDATGSTV